MTMFTLKLCLSALFVLVVAQWAFSLVDADNINKLKARVTELEQAQ